MVSGHNDFSPVLLFNVSSALSRHFEKREFACRLSVCPHLVVLLFCTSSWYQGRVIGITNSVKRFQTDIDATYAQT